MERFYTEEIVIGLCGPIGVDLPGIAKILSESLLSYEYSSEVIKLSKLIPVDGPGALGDPLRIKKSLIEAGNKLREQSGRGSILAEMAIEKILVDRTKDFPDEKYASRRRCFVIDSIKNASEARKLKEVYGESFYLVGVFSTMDVRVNNLTRGDSSRRDLAQEIIDDDYNQRGDFGQQVSKVFQTADYFFRLEGDAGTDGKVQRLIKLILGAEIITPNRAETAMFAAASAARNSACLSRQVGAAIIDDQGDIISTGWNDVPKYGGGAYSFGENDHRCFNSGRFCRNDQEKKALVSRIVDDLLASGAVDEGKREVAYKAIQNSPVSDLIEFSRAVHAEMLAILNAAKAASGQLKDAVLYCTTYPCHSCARHIVAAGIKAVYFIEPYAKSKATALHADSITSDEAVQEKLKILAYEGVAPSRFLDFFSIKNNRKKEGVYSPLPKKELRPQVDKMFESVHVLEAVVVKGLKPSIGGDDDGERIPGANAA